MPLIASIIRCTAPQQLATLKPLEDVIQFENLMERSLLQLNGQACIEALRGGPHKRIELGSRVSGMQVLTTAPCSLFHRWSI